jgi:hypothetical protein
MGLTDIPVIGRFFKPFSNFWDKTEQRIGWGLLIGGTLLATFIVIKLT